MNLTTVTTVTTTTDYGHVEGGCTNANRGGGTVAITVLRHEPQLVCVGRVYMEVIVNVQIKCSLALISVDLALKDVLLHIITVDIVCLCSGPVVLWFHKHCYRILHAVNRGDELILGKEHGGVYIGRTICPCIVVQFAIDDTLY